MLRLRLDVNGETIYTVEIVNKGQADGLADSVRWYEYSDSEGNKDRVFHDRKDGAKALALLVLDDVITMAEGDE